MSKELEVLERIKKWFPFKVNELEYADITLIETALKENIELKKCLKKCIDLIGDVETNSKKLKALEIIKKYKMIRFDNEWNVITTKGYVFHLTQEEFDLLKEVLL